MKLVRFVSSRHPDGACGVVTDDGTVEVIAGGLLDPIQKTGEVIGESEITRYLPPLRPPHVFAVGRNYSEHAAETNEDVPSAPLIFSKAPTCLIGHNELIRPPAIAPNHIDYEGELVAIIGKKAFDIDESQVPDYVLGYTCGNDVSARDCQVRDGQWTRAKGFDTFGPVGPYVVTGLDPAGLRIRTLVNGDERQNQPVSDMVFSVAHIISYISRGITLLPGTMVFTGTPGGVGFAKNPPVFLKPGDVCEVVIEGIGTLRNKVAAG